MKIFFLLTIFVCNVALAQAEFTQKYYCNNGHEVEIALTFENNLPTTGALVEKCSTDEHGYSHGCSNVVVFANALTAVWTIQTTIKGLEQLKISKAVELTKIQTEQSIVTEISSSLGFNTKKDHLFFWLTVSPRVLKPVYNESNPLTLESIYDLDFKTLTFNISEYVTEIDQDRIICHQTSIH